MIIFLEMPKVWALILAEDLRQADIARRLRCARSTVARALSKLDIHGLAQQLDNKHWRGLPADNDMLADIAYICGATSKEDRRKERHANERAQRATWAILKAKRAWERVHCGA